MLSPGHLVEPEHPAARQTGQKPEQGEASTGRGKNTKSEEPESGGCMPGRPAAQMFIGRSKIEETIPDRDMWVWTGENGLLNRTGDARCVLEKADEKRREAEDEKAEQEARVEGTPALRDPAPHQPEKGRNAGCDECDLRPPIKEPVSDPPIAGRKDP